MKRSIFDSAYAYKGFDEVMKIFDDIFETSSIYQFKDVGEKFELKLAVPGFNKNDVTVEEKEKHLYVVAKKSNNQTKSAVIPLLPYGYQDIVAKVEDGLLTIHLTKKTAEKTKKIEVL
jgi:HSP20 family molecular chaperone IbpA